MSSASRTVIVIVNYRSADLTLDCLDTLSPEAAGSETFGGFDVIVTDNDSPDDSVEVLQREIDQRGYGEWCKLMPLPKNGGFAYGNNEAIRAALKRDTLPDYVHLLNPDTLVRPGAIGALVRFMDEHPKVGIAGSRLEWPDGTQQHSAFRFHSIAAEFASNARIGVVDKLLKNKIVAPPCRPDTFQTDWVAGASLIVRRDVFDAVGLLDENYFMYYEEMDFVQQANRAGWPCYYVQDSRIVHLIGQVSGVTNAKAEGTANTNDSGEAKPVKPEPTQPEPIQRPKPRAAYWYDARAYYWRKCHGRFNKFVADVAFVAGLLSWRLYRRLRGKPDQDPQRLLRDFVKYNFLGKPLS